MKFNIETKNIQSMALREIVRGEEIVHAYGDGALENRTMEYFYLNYGFINSEAPMVMIFKINLTE